MDKYIDAYKMGQQAARLDFEKEANAKGIAELLRTLGDGAAKTTEGLGAALKRALGGAELTGKGLKYLGTTADPRKALMLGGGAALLGTAGPAIKAGLTGGLDDALLAAMPGLAATLGAGLAVAPNPGIFGGSAANRISHELAMGSVTPAGQLATMAGLVGLPAALIGYGKMKGREESSLF
tara:strand:+ start:495 stop:1037 length:543 start_codon:yes stop_codon:yes gene_type:complete